MANDAIGKDPTSNCWCKKWVNHRKSKYISSPEPLKSEIRLKIENLKRTVQTLEAEAETRRQKVKRLTTRRDKLMSEISFLRQQRRTQQMDRKFERLFKQVESIDDDLGPYRWLSKPFYLEWILSSLNRWIVILNLQYMEHFRQIGTV